MDLADAVSRHKWCWSCGSTDAKCAGWAQSGVQRKCCPDCRHPATSPELQVDVDMLMKTVKALVWKAGGRVDFSEKDLIDMPVMLPSVAVTHTNGGSGWSVVHVHELLDHP